MFAKPLELINSLIDLLIPRACLLCLTPTPLAHHLCQPCVNDLPILSHSCQKCAQFIHSNQRGHLLCGQCLASPPPYHKVYALYPYQAPLPKLVTGLKFEEKFSHAQFFSSMMIRAIRGQWYTHTPLPTLILAMPLSSERLRERGFNQALEIAKPVAANLDIQLDHSVIRSKFTLPQSTLSKQERKRNMANAFTTTRDYSDMHIAIIDDVMTTGQTVSALSRLLKRHGAARIDVWCVARCDARQ